MKFLLRCVFFTVLQIFQFGVVTANIKIIYEKLWRRKWDLTAIPNEKYLNEKAYVPAEKA